MTNHMLMLMDIALIASVPTSALCRNRVRQSAKRLVALPLASRQSRVEPAPGRPCHTTFRTLCRKLARRNQLDPAEAQRLQDLAARLLDDLQPRDAQAI